MHMVSAQSVYYVPYKLGYSSYAVTSQIAGGAGGGRGVCNEQLLQKHFLSLLSGAESSEFVSSWPALHKSTLTAQSHF